MWDRSFARRVLAVAAAALLPAAAGAQTFHIVPEKSLFVRKVPCGPEPQHLSPCAGGPGATGCVEVQHAGAGGAMRIGASITRSGGGDWSVRVRDARLGTTLETIALTATQQTVWTNDVPARGAIVELVSTQAGATGTLGVTRIVCEVVRAHEQAVVGVIGFADIVDLPPQHDWIKAAGRAVARLRFMTPAGEATCTGFMVSADTLMTNEHCINTAERVESLVADFGYDTQGSRSVEFRGDALLAADPALDYALVRMRGAPGRTWGTLVLAASKPAVGRDLVVIEHPAGRHKQVSLENCVVTAIDQKGAGAADSDFAHHCDTLSGSSGSPVIDRESRAVVGLHHFGFLFDDKPAINQAVESLQLPR